MLTKTSELVGSLIRPQLQEGEREKPQGRHFSTVVCFSEFWTRKPLTEYKNIENRYFSCLFLCCLPS